MPGKLWRLLLPAVLVAALVGFAPAAASVRGATAPGTIVSSKSVTISAVGLPVPVRAWQLHYASTDAKGQPQTGVATVLVPLIPYVHGKRPLLSYQTAEDSLATGCAPSATLPAGTEKELALISLGLAKGWAVVVSDYEGPQSEYGAGYQAGHFVLDAIRATLHFAPAGIAASAPIGLWGYSGGGLASAWAAELQPTYAPEVKLAGVAEGGVPPDLAAVARNIDGGAFAGIYFAVAVGLSRAYPEMDINAILNDKGKQLVASIGTKCITDIAAIGAFHRMAEYSTVPDPLALPRIQQVIAANHLGQHRPAGPIFDFHAIFDELIPIAGDDALAAQYCAEGVTVQHYRDPASEHASLAVTGAPLAVAYLADRFAAKPAPSTCAS
ncbi:lipase family protein [Fodinicola feengrottensis]|uniref:Lipase family protein n=1 Tax=Fodinicola feengrottensis TaxID=435914 RepID=A0ABN2IKZ3_9ACTN